ncbi:MAG TPA: cupin domain-containing protein [Rhodanobacteraceae bacterium]|nr:cupin domain-containing protein [Rhodanobacteraceae bacterium]
MTRDVINFAEKLSRMPKPWSPRVVAEMNDYQFKLVKLQGDFVWHQHAETDEVFIAVKGTMQAGFRDREVSIREGEMFVVPRGEEHIMRASEEGHAALIIEPRGVVNTGDVVSGLTAENDVWV